MKASIVIFHLPPKTNNTALSKFCQKFYGQETSSHHGKYRYRRHGLLDDIPHRKFIRGVIIVQTEHVEKVEEFLKQYSACCYCRIVELTAGDCETLGLGVE